MQKLAADCYVMKQKYQQLTQDNVDMALMVKAVDLQWHWCCL